MSSSDDQADGSTATRTSSRESTDGASAIDDEPASCFDGVAIKPAEVPVSRAGEVPFDTITVDYEGHDHVPEVDTLAALGTERTVRVTVPVRADGFDPLGDDGRLRALPAETKSVLVAGHPAYLRAEERRRAVAPRFREAMATVEDPWIGTEGVERIALATGGPQFELLSETTERDVRALRAAGFDGELAVYAPTVLTSDEDEILRALGGYVGRRSRVADRLPPGAETEATADGDARSILLAAAREYGLVGDAEEIADRAGRLRNAGVDTLIGYPARGLDEFVS
ncbi:MAG: luciferase [Halodesulfurarchaeum sp.]